ncbi:MAG: sodium/substrate symporter small subunit, partial [Pseudomonadota bacterium]|nr:sodium/substrate symporter small subunit [Pseudomonadota bacterium]
WAQQGSIYVFIGLIFFYTYKMKKIDRQFGVSDDDEDDI